MIFNLKFYICGRKFVYRSHFWGEAIAPTLLSLTMTALTLALLARYRYAVDVYVIVVVSRLSVVRPSSVTNVLWQNQWRHFSKSLEECFSNIGGLSLRNILFLQQ